MDGLKRRRRGTRARQTLAHESLEPRLCLAVSALADWTAASVAVRPDAWIFRASVETQVGDLALHTGWQAAHLGEGIFSLLAPGASSRDVFSWAQRTPDVSYVEPDFAINPGRLTNDPSLSQLWGLHNTGQSGGVNDADIDAPEAWTVTTGSRNVVVAVIDTGVDYTHPDLAANTWRNPGEVPGDGIDNDRNGFIDDVHGWDFANNDSNPMDDDGHGTHVAGTIGAIGNNSTGVVGVNWQVSIMALKFLGADGSGSTSGAIAAINYATRMRRDFGVNVVVSNNSWGGGGQSNALRDAIEAGGRAGILFVAAAGNDARNNDTSPSYPASYTSQFVISVAATDRANRLSSFSNFGVTSVDLGAPGSSIQSTVLNAGYASYSGTSMAAPHVAGAVALLASARSGATPGEVRSAILGTTTPVAALAGRTATGGLLNVDAALRRLTNGGPIIPPPSQPAPPPPSQPTPPPAQPPISGPLESNDSIASATRVNLISGSASLQATIGDGPRGSADVDVFAVQLQAGGRLTIDIDARTLPVASSLDAFVRVFDSSGRQLASNDDSCGSLDSLLDFSATAGGTFFVGVSSFGNSSYDPRTVGSAAAGRTTGAYIVRFSLPGTAAPLSVDIVDVTPDPRTTAVDEITIRFNRAVTGFDLADLRLVRNCASVSLAGASLRSTDGGVTWRLTGLGAATAASGSYTLTLNHNCSGIRDASGLLLTSSARDSWVTNLSIGPDAGDTFLTAQSIVFADAGTRVTGRVGDGAAGSRDVDMYTVTLAAGQSLVIDVDARALGGGSTLDSFVRVFNASRREVASNDDSACSLDSFLTFRAETSGTYFIGVSGFGNSAYDPAVAGSGRNASTGVYCVSFRVQPATTVRSVAPGSVAVLGFRDDLSSKPAFAFAMLASQAVAASESPGTTSRRR